MDGAKTVAQPCSQIDQADVDQTPRTGSGGSSPRAWETAHFNRYRREAQEALDKLPSGPYHDGVQSLLGEAEQIAGEGGSDVRSARVHLRSLAQKLRRAGLHPVAGAGYKQEHLEARVPNFGEVIPGQVLRGGQPSKAGLRWLASQGVRTVVSFRSPKEAYAYTPDFDLDAEARTCRELGMNFVNLATVDQELPQRATVERFLALAGDSASQPMFVHCAGGVGRTSTYCGILLRQHGLSMQQIARRASDYQMWPKRSPDEKAQMDYIAQFPLDPGPTDGWNVSGATRG